MRDHPAGPVLIVAPTGRDAQLAAEVLEKAGVPTQIFGHLTELSASIGPAAGAVLLAEEALAEAEIETFLAALSAQEPWSDLPVLLLTRGDAARDRSSTAIARLAPATFVTLLERPFRTATLISTVEAALRARKRQWQVRDLFTQRNEALVALAESEDRTRVATEAANVGTWDFFPDTGKLIWNDRCRAHFGLPPGTPITYQVFLDGLHPDDRQFADTAVVTALHSPEKPTFDIEYRTISPSDGEERWIAASGRATFDTQGKAMRFTGTTVDITERKHFEIELSETHRFLHSTIDALSSHLAVLDENGVILAVNKAWRLFADQNDYAGLNYGIGSRYLREPITSGGTCHEEASVAAGLSDVLAARRDHFEMEYPCHSPTEKRWFLMRVTPFPTPGPRRVVVAHENITERKLGEEALREAKSLAEAANAAKDQFLATLSHELRTPLTPVLMCLSDHTTDPSLPEELREDLAMIRRNVELEARLIDDLLDLTRVSRGKVELRTEIVDVHKVLQEALEVCTANDTVRRQLLITLETPAKAHHVLADHARLQQVFWNLINNAIKFSSDGGRICILTSNPQPRRLAISVSDEGIGIEAEKMAQLFNAFEQGGRGITRRFGGLGLGLAISKALVELHGGTIRAASDGHQRGATFTVELETRAPSASSVERAPQPRAEASGPLRILLVEDHGSTLQVLTRLLRRAGHEVCGAASLNEARQWLATHPFDLLISDLGLPDGNGTDLIRELGDHPLPSIALSGYGMESDVRECLAAGFRGHITKPVDWVRLKAIIHELTTRV